MLIYNVSFDLANFPILFRFQFQSTLTIFPMYCLVCKSKDHLYGICPVLRIQIKAASARVQMPRQDSPVLCFACLSTTHTIEKCGAKPLVADFYKFVHAEAEAERLFRYICPSCGHVGKHWVTDCPRHKGVVAFRGEMEVEKGVVETRWMIGLPLTNETCLACRLHGHTPIDCGILKKWREQLVNKMRTASAIVPRFPSQNTAEMCFACQTIGHILQKCPNKKLAEEFRQYRYNMSPPNVEPNSPWLWNVHTERLIPLKHPVAGVQACRRAEYEGKNVGRQRQAASARAEMDELKYLTEDQLSERVAGGHKVELNSNYWLVRALQSAEYEDE